jgi:hypothetical protein
MRRSVLAELLVSLSLRGPSGAELDARSLERPENVLVPFGSALLRVLGESENDPIRALRLDGGAWEGREDSVRWTVFFFPGTWDSFCVIQTPMRIILPRTLVLIVQFPAPIEPSY